LKTFPVWELDFGKLGEVQSAIATRRVKWTAAIKISTGSSRKRHPDWTRRNMPISKNSASVFIAHCH